MANDRLNKCKDVGEKWTDRGGQSCECLETKQVACSAKKTENEIGSGSNYAKFEAARLKARNENK
jgi:hypothetical protein